MESAIIETVGCPLDLDLLKSWEKFTLECSNSYISSKHSKSTVEEIDITQDSLIQQLKNLSCDDGLDSKHVSSRYSNESTEKNARKKDSFENLIFLEDKENEKDQSSSFSPKNKECFKFTVEADVKSVNSELSNKNSEINSQNKNNTERLDNTELNENEFSTFLFENNKLFKNVHESSSGASAEDESDSDNEALEKSVTLRERYPNRHNRSENNRQKRTVPFPQNHSKTFQQHLYSNNSPTSVNYYSTWNNVNVSHDGFEYLNQNNSTISDRYNRTVPSKVLNSEYMTGEAFESITSRTTTDYIVNGVNPCAVSDEIVKGVIPCDVTDQIVHGVIQYDIADQMVNDINSCNMTDQMVNSVIPCAAADQMVDGVIPCENTDQIVNGVIPCENTDKIVNGVITYSVMDEVFDSVVPAAGNIANMNDNFSVEINDVSYFDNMAAKLFPESIDKGSAITNEERLLDSHFEDLTAEEVDYILKNIIKFKSDTFPGQNQVALIKENCVANTSEEISYPKRNLHNFGSEFDGLHSSFSNTNVEENTYNSNLYTKSGILEKPGEFHSYECSANKSGNYSNMVSENFTSINSGRLSPEAADYNNISEEIETFISRKHDIVQWDEMKEWVMKGPKNVSELSPPVTKTSWNELPFVDLDSNSLSKCINISESEVKIRVLKTDKRKGSKSKQIDHVPKSAYKAEEPKICRIWGTLARDKLFHSAEFDIRNWELENEKMRHQIKKGEIGTEQKKVIHFLRKNRKTKYKGTNLHYAIRAENTEKVFCIVELHKECHGTTFEINFRDSDNKTVLDYSKKEGMEFLTDYLEENDAKKFAP